MNSHTNEQQAFIVKRLAAFDPPRDIVAAFVVRYRDTACSEADVLACDPRTHLLSPELHALFYEERARVLADPHAAVFAERQARLIVLSRQAERYSESNQLADVRAVFRQIAEEVEASDAAGGSANDNAEDLITEIRREIVDPANPPAAEADTAAA